MSGLAEAGHGVEIALELGTSPAYTPVGGSFTVIGEVIGDVAWPGLTAPEFEVTAHNDDIDFWKSGVLRREPLTFTVQYVDDDTVHEGLVNIVAIQPQPHRGFRLRGPGGSASNDEWIASGFIQSLGPITHPLGSGARTAQVTVRLSGPMRIDGVAYPA